MLIDDAISMLLDWREKLGNVPIALVDKHGEGVAIIPEPHPSIQRRFPLDNNYTTPSAN